MSSQDVEPQLGAESFSCPHCNAVAHQDWFSIFLKPENATDAVVLTPEAAITLTERDDDDDDRQRREQFLERLKKNDLTYHYEKYPQNVKVKMVNLHLSSCYNCNGFSVWVRDRLVFPFRVAERPDLVAEDFEEAATILDKSPRGAAALIHLSIQTLMQEKGKQLDDEIASLISKGLQVEIQEAMDALQVLGNNGGHSGQTDLKEDKATATRIFALLKMIVERRTLKNRDQN
jgi:Domain of unknown function (DUF4145)